MIYFIGGVLFMRFARNARGLQQIPNFRFWNRVGNFQAVNEINNEFNLINANDK